MNNLSLILVNSKKGEFLISLINNTFKTIECDYKNAIKYNHQLIRPSQKQKYTEYYFLHFHDKTTKKIIKKAYPKIIFKCKIKQILIKLHLFKVLKRFKNKLH